MLPPLAPWPVDPARLALFSGLMVALAATPGPAVLFSIANGVHRGAAGVLAGCAGIAAASAVWFVGAGVGLGALMRAAPWLFAALTWFGVGYLLWLGLGKVRAGLTRAEVGPERARVRPGRSAFADGFAVQVANPKVVLFFSGVLPPFLDVARPLPAQLALLAIPALGIDYLALALYGLGGAALAAKLRTPSGSRHFSLVSGLLLITAAILIALTRR